MISSGPRGNEPYTIVTVTAKDAKALAEVHVNSWRDTYRGLMPQELLDSLSYDEREAMWRKLITENLLKRHLWAAKDSSGKIVGFSTGGPIREGASDYDGEVYAIYLDRELHGKGIGKELFLNSLEQLFRHGFTKAIVWVLETNPTRGFYEKLGGVQTAEKWKEFGGQQLKEIAYGWKDILATLKEFRPELRHPNIKHFSELQEKDGESHYQGSSEWLSIGSAFAKKMGLKRIGIHHELLPPGRRTSWPHAEEDEEEFIYVLEGNPHVWIDGEIYSLNPGDGVAFSSASGMSHTFLNNTTKDVRLLVIGEASKPTSKVFYPYHPERKEQVKENWWTEVPKRKLGAHKGVPDVHES